MEKGEWERSVERVNNIVAAILAVGLSAAVVIFFTAQPPPGNPLGYEFTDSKPYLRDVEMIGGKANLLTAQFRTWVTGLFQGRSLAYTIAFLTIALALAVWLFATPLPPEPPSEGEA
jgi:hypothetical protein